MRRKRSSSSRGASEPTERGAFDRSHDDDLDLSATPDSDLDDFGESGTRGFSDAWDVAVEEDPDDHASVAESFGSDVDDDDRTRDLDRRSKRGVVALVAVVLVGLGLGLAVQNGWLTGDPERVEDELIADTPIVAPGEARIYEAEPTSVELVIGAVGAAGFEVIDGASPVVANDLPVRLPATVSAGPLIWAGRLHIAVLGEQIGIDEERCMVVTMVDGSFLPIDLAAHGECAPELAATGDRLACQGEDLILLEVWANDPRSAKVPPPVVAIRFRAEATSNSGGVYSRRGSFTASPGERSLLEVSPVVGGAPGDEITITFADGVQRSTCTLIDRADVPVKLLPS